MSMPNDTEPRSLARFFRSRNSRTHAPMSLPFLSTAVEMSAVASAGEPANGGSFEAASPSASPASEASDADADALLLADGSGLDPAHPAVEAKKSAARAANEETRTIQTFLSGRHAAERPTDRGIPTTRWIPRLGSQTQPTT